MKARATFGWLVLVTACGGVVGGQTPGEPPEPALVDVGIVRQVPADEGDLVFPVLDEGRRDRGALPDDYRPALERGLTIVSPDVDAGRVSIDARTLTVTFNQPMRGAKAGAAAGAHLSIAHAEPQPGDRVVTGLVTWTDERTLELTSDGFLDPKREYRIELRGLESVSGQRLADRGFGLTSQTGGVVAGKAIGHVPEAGQPRVVVISPDDHSQVKASALLTVLYDQPIGLDLARQLVQLRDAGGNVVPVALRHAFGDSWQGARVDRRQVIVATPLRRQLAGSKLVFHADDRTSARDAREHEVKLTVADPLVLTGAECSWYSREDERCEVSGDTVRTDRRELHLRFNNPIASDAKKLKALVRVTPAVRNLVVAREGWDEGRVVLTGDFKPSVRYAVSVGAIRDRFDQMLSRPLRVALEIEPLGASVAMPEGLIVLDETATKAFAITSRNVEEAELRLWRVSDDVRAFSQALSEASGVELSRGKADKTLSVKIAASANNLVETQIDLRAVLAESDSWLATVVPTRMAFAAAPLKFPEGSAAARAPVALLKPGSQSTLAVHTHSMPGATLVHVARLASGEPVPGAQVIIGEDKATSDAGGVAVIARDTIHDSAAFVQVIAGSDKLMLPLGRALQGSEELFPEMAGEASDTPFRGMVISDRGIYRPGATVGIKTSLFGPRGARLEPQVDAAVVVNVVGPTGDTVCHLEGTTSKLGGYAGDCALAADAKLGLHRIELSRGDAVVARTLVRVADFEPPRFKVDVEADASRDKLSANVSAKYLFGAPMDGAWAKWSLTRQPAPFPDGPLSAAGLGFRDGGYWFDDEPNDKWAHTGEGALAGDGTLRIDQALSFAGATGPLRFTIEADVSDASYRHVANRKSVVVHSAARYAGLKAPGGWVNSRSDVPVELGVMDTDGQPVTGATVTATMKRVSWRYIERRGPGGSVTSEWRREEREAGRCSATSAVKPVPCTLRVMQSGDYRIVASVDGREGGASWFWAWGDGDRSEGPTPTQGNLVQISSDKPRYLPGETAQLMVRNPYRAATAVLTLEMGRLLRHETKRVEGAAVRFDVPLDAAHAPHVHATVTLLPVGASRADAASYRVGAVRLPVALSGTTLDVAVKSDKASYGPGDEVALTVAVHDGGKPESNAEIALAVVDEGVLRLTDFHAADPVPALRPPLPLTFSVRDSRAGLMSLLESSHVAGDGGGDEMGSLPNTRRRFLQTALWKPQLSTDANGEARLRFKLPDNLTEWRMMAVVVDGEGKGGRAESSFVVKKDLLLDAVMPRFAHVGDSFELAAMVHNGAAVDFSGSVVIDGQTRAVTIPAGGRARVAVLHKPTTTSEREVKMALVDARGAVKDAVARKLTVTQPGYALHPTLASAFVGDRKIDLRIPDEALIDEHAALSVKLGEHLWPEVGERLGYLMRYPHGCVEQTTSSTLPLIAGREIMPRIGVEGQSESWYRERIEHGLERLWTMRTSSGGLGYWPGDSEPSIFGTSYAIRAVLGAKRAGIDVPEGMLEGMLSFLRIKLLASSTEPDLRAVIAESLSTTDEGLPPGIADALLDRSGEMTVFARASLAIALARTKGQEDRARALLEEIEALFDSGKTALAVPWRDGEPAAGYYGSDRRTRAQIAIALEVAERKGTLGAQLIHEIASDAGEYTTQSTAFGLLALATHLRSTPPDGAPVAVLLAGVAIDPYRTMEGGAKEYRIPLRLLKGQKAQLTLSSPSKQAIGYAISTSYRMPLKADGDVLRAASGSEGPDLFRVLTTPEGDPIDPTRIKAGDLVRVALLAVFKDGASRHEYLALTDRLPAGFEPVEQDLASVASAPGLREQHPFSRLLRWGSSEASHVELHDDHVQLYFDKPYGAEVAATYLARATTPGTFAQPPAVAELMYEPRSTSFSAGGEVVIQ